MRTPDAMLKRWWPFAAKGIRNWRRRRDDRRRWKAGAALREQAAQDEARRAEYNETNGPTRP